MTGSMPPRNHAGAYRNLRIPLAVVMRPEACGIDAQVRSGRRSKIG